MSAAPRPLTSLHDLAAAGLLPEAARAALAPVAARYAVAVTPAMAALIDPADPADPIARQFIPDARELDRRPEERTDPIGDDAHSPVRGIVHRHADRVLLKLLAACPVYCRFCFRRDSVGPGTGGLTPAELEAALAYIAGDPAIWEVILTGGDPLMLAPRRVADLVGRLAGVAHVKVLRWHTRVPVVDPGRVTDDLVRALRGARPATYVAIHANHPRELTQDARAALAKLADAGIPLLSQSVLLAGVNDDVETLAALMRGFVESRVKPYYLHHPDLAPGTAHLRPSLEAGRLLVRALRSRLSGIAMPAYVLDIPGGYGKVPIGPDHVADGAVEDLAGRRHPYPPRSVA